MRLRREHLWALSLHPDAAEGGGCLSVVRGPLSAGGPPNVERSAEEAGRRARTKIRRYAAANRLNRLGTLTYRGEGCHDPVRLRGDLAGFFRELRSGIDEGRFPYVWVPQWHPGGHGLHAHFAVGRFMPRKLIERSWSNGFVHIKLLDGLPVGSGALAEARLAARYLARYVGRELEDERRRSWATRSGSRPTTTYTRLRTTGRPTGRSLLPALRAETCHRCDPGRPALVPVLVRARQNP